MSRFHECLAFTLKWEGGYVNHPNDPGGATNRGITQRTYDNWRVEEKLPVRDVKKIGEQEIIMIYSQNYWMPSKAAFTPRGLDLCVFDSAVNMGPRQSIKFLQRIINEKEDGIFGSKTSKGVNRIEDYVTMIRYYCQVRETFYKDLVIKDDKFRSFIRGWMNRNNALRDEALNNNLYMA